MPARKQNAARKGTLPSSEYAAPQPQTPVAWPPLKPVLEPSILVIEEVLPQQILTISEFFTAQLCKAYVNFLQKTVTLSTTPGKPKRGDAVRVNDRFQIQDAAFAERLWNDTGLKEIVNREDPSLWGGEVVGLNPKTGQFFDKHYDDSNQLQFGEPPAPCRTTWTLLIYLTGAIDGVVGGETVFYSEASKAKKSEEYMVKLERGLAVLHRHGRQCMLHEGRAVTDDGSVGKWVLRSDLVVTR